MTVRVSATPHLYFLNRRPCGANRFGSGQSGTVVVLGSRGDKAAVTAAISAACFRWSMPPNDPNAENGAGGCVLESPGRVRSTGAVKSQGNV